MVFKKINYRHYICISITLIFLLLAIFYFKYAGSRFIESCIDIYNSFKFYISELFELNLKGDLTINNFSSQPFVMPFNLPSTWDEFKILFNAYFKLIFNFENFKSYLRAIGNFIYYGSRYLIILLPFVLIIFLVLQRKKPINNKYNIDSKPLKLWKKLEKKVINPFKIWILTFIHFIKENRIYAYFWLLIWLYNFNVYTIFFEFIAYYLYFVVSFDFIHLYVQVLKLFFDLSVLLDFVPSIAWFIIAFYFIDKYRRKRGYEVLNHLERKNTGFIVSQPLVTMYCGTMGSNKTSIITDQSISLDIYYRYKAFQFMMDIYLEYPNFPWINLDLEIKKAIKKHSIFNLVTCEEFVNSYFKKFSKRPNNKNIFGYDYLNNKMYHDDGLKVRSIWESINDYTKLYLIYTFETSLILSNYSIRTDIVKIDLGNLPQWNFDLFKKDPLYAPIYSKFSHILDFDCLRIFKLFLNNNKYADFLDFGIISISEIDKERKNQVELQGVKKSSDETNQKNDGFNTNMKFDRHRATIRYFCFLRFVSDGQRPNSVNADLRELMNIIHITETSDLNIAMPFYDFEYFIFDKLICNFNDKYSDFRFRRGDNTLLMYWYHNIISKIKNYHECNLNTFGFYVSKLLIESGSGKVESKTKEYYLMKKKVYSDRYSTDAFAEIFKEKNKRSKVGLGDIPTYKTVLASSDEFDKQHSYAVIDLKEIVNKDLSAATIDDESDLI